MKGKEKKKREKNSSSKEVQEWLDREIAEEMSACLSEPCIWVIL